MVSHKGGRGRGDGRGKGGKGGPAGRSNGKGQKNGPAKGSNDGAEVQRRKNAFDRGLEDFAVGDVTFARKIVDEVMQDKEGLYTAVKLDSDASALAFLRNLVQTLAERGEAGLLLDFLSTIHKCPIEKAMVSVISEALRVPGVRSCLESHAQNAGSTSVTRVRRILDVACMSSDHREQSIHPTLDELVDPSKAACLPQPPTSTAELTSEDHLRRQFWLLREDMVAPLRDELQNHLRALKFPTKKDRDLVTARRRQVVNAFAVALYTPNIDRDDHPVFKHIPPFRARNGKDYCPDVFVVMQFSYSPQSSLKGKSFKERMESIKASRGFLPEEGLVCLLDEATHAPLCLLKIKHRSAQHLARDDEKWVGVSWDDPAAGAVLLAEIGSKRRFILATIGGALYSHPPVLERLQRIPRVPMSDLVLKGERGEDELRIPLARNDKSDLQLSLEELDEMADLHPKQSEAVHSALTQRLSLIQGPPGTGKTYVGTRVVQLLKQNSTSERILIVCYTNAALEQFLTKLVRQGCATWDEILRVGGVPGGAVPEASHISHVVRRPEYDTQDWAISKTNRELRDQVDAELDRVTETAQLCFSPAWDDVRRFLKAHDPQAASALKTNTTQHGDFTMVDSKGKPLKSWSNFEQWKRGGQKYGAGGDAYPWALTKPKRQALYHQWLTHLNADKVASIARAVPSLKEIELEKMQLRHGRWRRVVKDRRVIGCTSTFLAKHPGVLDSVTTLLLEEAGELLESTSITCMAPRSLRRVVNIGDHKQLRPKAAHYKISVESGSKHRFNLSLFERLAEEGYPVTALQVQHRMRPEISAFVRPNYDVLEDGPGVGNQPLIPGLRTNVVFATHDKPENGDSGVAESGAKSNPFEVKMAVAMVKYVRQQGIHDVVVLTPYLAQVHALRAGLKNAKLDVGFLTEGDAADVENTGQVDCEGEEEVVQGTDGGVRVSTIDNFQGEEADVIVCSLVRSNKQGQAGWTAGRERTNVLFSRAKRGLLITGNLATLTAKSSVWQGLEKQLEDGRHLHNGVPVGCPHGRHALLTCAEDFGTYAPDGGCTMACADTLPCGHPCPRSCHRGGHEKVQCKEEVMVDACPKGHAVFVECRRRRENHDCPTCAELAKLQKIHTERMLAAEKALEREKQRVEVEKKKADLELERLRNEIWGLETWRDAEMQNVKASLAADEAQRAAAHEHRVHAVKLRAQIAKLQSEEAAKQKAADEARARERKALEAAKKASIAEVEKSKQQYASKTSRVTSDATMTQDLSDCVQAIKTASTRTDVVRVFEKHRGSLERMAGRDAVGHIAACVKAPGALSLAEDLKTVLCKVLHEEPCFTSLSGIVEALPSDPAVCDAVRCVCDAAITGLPAEAFSRPRCAASASPAEVALAELVLFACVGRVERCIPKADTLAAPYTWCVAAACALACDDERVQKTLFAVLRRSAARLPDKVASPGLSLEALAGKLGAPQKDVSSKERDQRRRDMAAGQQQGMCNDVRAFKDVHSMIGLDKVKACIHGVLGQVLTAKKLGRDFQKNVQYSARFTGNPGTGKTTVARLYGRCLSDVGVIPKDAVFEETSGTKLASKGVDDVIKLIEKLSKSGGTLFIDEAYQLVTGDPRGKQVLDVLLTEMENHKGRLVVVIAGYPKEIDQLLAVNQGLVSRFPHAVKFEDYTQEELLQILKGIMAKDISAKDQRPVFMPEDPRFLEIAVRRVARRGGQAGFANAREMANLYQQMTERHARRHSEERVLAKADILGVYENGGRTCEAYEKLLGMEGLKKVKAAVDAILDVVDDNNRLEEALKEPRALPLNRILLGNPGTGKTTVAQHLGKILCAAGVLSKGDVVMKTASDLIGSVIGESEKLTAAALESASGCVLVIDEAYGFDPAVSGGKCPYREGVLNTMVEKISGQGTDDRAVLLLGYESNMRDMARGCNPGFNRRFNLDDAWVFEDFSDDALVKILLSEAKRQTLKLKIADARAVVREDVSKLRRKPNFGNAGAVKNLLATAVQNAQLRVGGGAVVESLTRGDFLPPEAAAAKSRTMADIFAGLHGVGHLEEKFGRIQRMCERTAAAGGNAAEQVPMAFRFVGPPGTGKTTVAKRVGELYCALGLLGGRKVHVKSIADFVTGYAQQAVKKTREVFREALGEVLFIDEAYRLSREKEVLDEIVDLMTSDEHRGKMVVVLGGYQRDIDEMLTANDGLRSRFPEEILFAPFSPEVCADMLRKKCRDHTPPVKWDEAADKELAAQLQQCVGLSSWANARDVETLVTKLYAQLCDKPGHEDSLTCQDVSDVLDRFRADLTRAVQAKPQAKERSEPLPSASATSQAPAVCYQAASRAAEADATPAEQAEQGDAATDALPSGDNGVWNRPPLTHEFLHAMTDRAVALGITTLGQLSTKLDSPELAQGFDPETVSAWRRIWRDEEARRVEIEREARKKKLRPVYRCAVCGRYGCPVAPYVEKYEEFDA
eukprot:TRINITY_DN3805_c0_g1_i2.p1 TRINITY_DN3805_c0_g1~~TRINITY_DN3805_c0_g1_i2.p1  ORF type:complete len:2457 (+),score=568.87 TRINITY_DN3805_c0_g1_i2:120-7490(+)